MLLAQSGAEATILTSLARSWKVIANQTDRYVAIMKREAAQKGRLARPVVRTADLPLLGKTSKVARPERGCRGGVCSGKN